MHAPSVLRSPRLLMILAAVALSGMVTVLSGSSARATDPDVSAMKTLFEKLEKAWRGSDEASFRRLYVKEGYAHNLVGGSGLAGKGAYRQGAAKGWFFKPDFKTLGGVTRGEPWLVSCDVWSWKKKRRVDRVWVLFATHKGGLKVIGAGENKAEVEALGMRWHKKLPLRPPQRD